MKNEKLSYILRPEEKSRSETSAALCAKCSEGEIGEHLIREGFSKRGWNQFVLALVKERISKGKPDSVILDAMGLINAENASASRQALMNCSLHFEMLDEKGESILAKEDSPFHLAKKGEPMFTKEATVETHWKTLGNKGSKPALSCLAD